MNITLLVVAASIGLQPGTPPRPERIEKVREIHGERIVDEYAWMRERENPKVLEHLRAENAYAKEVMADAESLQRRLYDEMLGRIKQTDMSVPTREDGYLYYFRTEEGKGYRTYGRRKDQTDAPEEVTLDVNALAAGKAFLIAGPFEVSPDTKVLAYGVDPTGARRWTIRFKDLTTGKELEDKVENASGNFTWAADSRTYFYGTLDDAVRSDKVWRRRLGDDPSAAELIHHEKDERYSVGVGTTPSEKYILLRLGSMKTSEVWYLDAKDSTGQFRVIEPRREGVEYSVDHHGDRFFILHNDGALNFTLCEAPVAKPGRANWRTVIPHREDTFLVRLQCFAGHLAISQRENGLQQIRVRRLSDGAEHMVSMPDAAYALSPSANTEFETARLRFEYSSPITPQSVFEYDMETRARTLLKEQPVLGGYDRTRYTVERIQAPAPDGQLVPVTVTYPKGLTRGGKNPCLLVSYGSYGSSSDPSFRSHLVSLLDRGFVCATAHIRGGSDKGRGWYEAGRLMNKKNTFTDFIAAAEFLVAEKYTSPDRLAIRGGSAGGLLMGAVINASPDLFAVCIADVPFVDVINSMLDPGLPLTVAEYEQWGNPNERAAFEYMRSYSPYDNVGAKGYPDILATTAWNDSQVCFWEPAKWVARLRDRKTGDGVVVLKTNLDSGHGGASDRYKAIEEEAFRYAFILDRLGIRE